MARYDNSNSEFWNEACGTALAKDVGATTLDLEGFAKFDAAYFDLYPFLLGYIPLDPIHGKSVLEIGLGYGAISQKIALSAADYQGVDIAVSPLEIVSARLRLNGCKGNVVRGSALDLPYPDNCFDYVVSIGCLHHTGDTQRAIDQVLRVLKPGGVAVVMVYNALCYKNWIVAPLETLKMLFRPPSGLGNAFGSGALRLAHDRDSSGDAPPETAFFSVRELEHLFSGFSNVNCKKENCYLRLPLSWRRLRYFALRTIGRLCGLSVYVTAVK